jgi:hypothetical protein
MSRGLLRGARPDKPHFLQLSFGIAVKENPFLFKSFCHHKLPATQVRAYDKAKYYTELYFSQINLLKYNIP